MICEKCGKEKPSYSQCNTIGYVVEDGTKWLAKMCGETNDEYVARWSSNLNARENDFWAKNDKIFEEKKKRWWRTETTLVTVFLIGFAVIVAIGFVKGW